MALCALSAFATTAEIWLSSDSSGETRVSLIQEGDEVWIVVSDPDNNIDCDVRDKFWGDVKIMDPKTGAYIIWNNGGYYGLNLQDTIDGLTNSTDYFEETGADTGLFVSSRPFQIGTRENYATVTGVDEYRTYTHVVDDDDTDFQWGHYLYTDESGSTGDTEVDSDEVSSLQYQYNTTARRASSGPRALWVPAVSGAAAGSWASTNSCRILWGGPRTSTRSVGSRTWTR